MMNSMKATRWTSLGLFFLFTLPVLLFLSLSVRAFTLLWFVDTAVRAVPLYLAIWFDTLFYDGGELSEEFIPLWVALTGVLLWPLLAIGIKPMLWSSRRARRAILSYAAAAVVCTVPAAWWIFTHTGYLF